MIRSYENFVPRYEDDGGVLLEPEAPLVAPPAMTGAHFSNFASYDVPENIDTTAAFLTRMLDSDAATRAPFVEEAKRLLKLLGTGVEAEPDDFDYEDSDTSTHHLLALAHTRFMARTLAEILPPNRIFRAEPIFNVAELQDPQMRAQLGSVVEAASRRVEEFYYDYFTQRLPGYVEGLDRTVWDIGFFGLGHRKIYVDPTYINAPVRVEPIPFEDLLISHDGRRKTHFINMPAQEVVRRMNAGIYRTIDISGSPGITQSPITQQRDKMAAIRLDHDAGRDIHALAEVHVDLFFEGDPHPAGLARPYVVTIHTATQEVLAFRRNWRPDDPEERPIQNFTHTVYHPGHRPGTAVGLAHLLANITGALTNAQRRGLDAAMLANRPVGFKHASFTIRNDAHRYVPGTLIDVDSPAQRISDAVMMHPFRGPEPGLLTMIERLEQNGKELGGVATMDFEQMMKSGVAAGPAMAAFDQSHEFDTAVHRRLYHGNETEARLVHAAMREQYANRPVPFGEGRVLQPEDLIMCRLLPAMRPGHVTRQRRMLEAESVYQKAATHPENHDMREVLLFYYNALGVESPERFLAPLPQDAKPTDIVTEYMRLMRGEPIAVGPAQNHAAHIDGHLAQLQGLENSSMPAKMGENIAAILASHIADHIAWQLAVEVAGVLGIPPDAFLEGIPPDVEYQIAPMVAQAVQMVEQARAKPTEGDIRMQIEELRAQNKIAIEELRAQTRIAERAQQSTDAKRGNDADILMNREDNATALIIASIKNAARPPSTNPGAAAPTNNPTPTPRTIR